MEKAESIALSAGKDYGINEAMVIYTSKIDIRNYVLLKCRFGCTRYGKSHNCPPNTPTPDEMRKILSEYKKAILVGGDVKGIEGQKKITEGIIEIERKLFLDGFYRSFALTPGSCMTCKDCTYPEGKACNSPEKCRPSMESVGIDVFSTLRKFKKNMDVIKDRTKFTCYGLILLE